MALETNVKVKLVKWYFENAKSIVKTPRTFKCFNSTKKAPARNLILYIVKTIQIQTNTNTRSVKKTCGA